MKKAVAFLLAFLIFVAPMTTFVKADVVIGDNDDIIVNENATILGRKLALMESLSDLALSGVTEFTISNTNDVDTYLDYLWNEVNDAIDYINSGEGFQDLSNELKSKYFYNLINYRDYITNRGDYLSYTLQNPTTSLLQTYFANNIYGKIDTSHYDLALDMFKALEGLNQGSNTPTPNPDPNYQTLIDYMNKRDSSVYNSFWFYNYPQTYYYNSTVNFTFDTYPLSNYSWFSYTSSNGQGAGFSSGGTTGGCFCTDIVDLNIVSNNGVYSIDTYLYGLSNICHRQDNTIWNCVVFNTNGYGTFLPINGSGSIHLTSSGSLNVVLNYLKNICKNINIYVDGVCWAYVGGSVPQLPLLDIDGYIKIYGNEQPQQYELQPNTKIDYDQLYQVIYNAIRDNLPISQGDINYYDSHDTIYSPTIINNYGDEEGNENDIIDTILDYAVIPKFDTSIAQPMRAALTNGVVIMQNSITNVIPDEILLILGACFFLLLFAVVINRMIK